MEEVRARECLTDLWPLVHAISDAGAYRRAVLFGGRFCLGHGCVDRVILIARLLTVFFVGFEDEITGSLAPLVLRVAVALGWRADFLLLSALKNFEGRVVQDADQGGKLVRLARFRHRLYNPFFGT